MFWKRTKNLIQNAIKSPQVKSLFVRLALMYTHPFSSLSLIGHRIISPICWLSPSFFPYSFVKLFSEATSFSCWVLILIFRYQSIFYLNCAFSLVIFICSQRLSSNVIPLNLSSFFKNSSFGVFFTPIGFEGNISRFTACPLGNFPRESLLPIFHSFSV